MKTKLKSIEWLMIILLAASFIACKKEKNNDEVEEIVKLEKLNKKIQDIIPTQYLDSLKKMGLTIYSGTSPVNVEGTFSIQPMILKSTNVKNDYPIGHRFSDAVTRLFDQTENLDIKLIGENFLADRDTSIVTAVSGTENQFTVYGKVKATKNGKQANFAIIFSGTMDGNTMLNMNYGLICIENKNINDNTFIKEGEGRLFFESDLVSDRIAANQPKMVNNSIQLNNIGAPRPAL